MIQFSLRYMNNAMILVLSCFLRRFLGKCNVSFKPLTHYRCLYSLNRQCHVSSFLFSPTFILSFSVLRISYFNVVLSYFDLLLKFALEYNAPFDVMLHLLCT